MRMRVLVPTWFNDCVIRDLEIFQFGTMRTVIHTKHQYRTLFTCLLTHTQVKQEVVQIRLVHNSVLHQSAVSWFNSQNCILSRSISSPHSDIKIANSSLKYFTTSEGIASPLLHTVSLKLALIPYLRKKLTSLMYMWKFMFVLITLDQETRVLQVTVMYINHTF